MSNVLIGIIGVILFIGLALAGALFLGPRFQAATISSKASATVVMPAALASPLTAEPAPMSTLNSPPEMVTDCCSEKSRLAAAAAVASFQIRKVTVRVAVIPLPEASTTLPL